MPIRFSCEQCRHEIEVEKHFVGKHGVCKHCGHALVVPEETEAAFLLRPAADEPTSPHARLLDPHSPLLVKPASAEPHFKPHAITGPDDPDAAKQGDYTLTNRGKERRGSSGIPPFWYNAPSLIARSLARWLRTLRDYIYIVSLGALVIALIGFLFKMKALLHLGVVIAIASNMSMFVVGMSYLLTLPFKEGLRYGLANVLIPFYAIYYWYSRWPKMKAPVKKTIGSFLPIFLATTAFFLYEDGPKLLEAGEKGLPIIEEKIEESVNKLNLGPIKRIGEKVEGSIDTSDDKPKEQPR